VEKNFLWAVVSLPSGVFQPYSGVKTSILFMDKVLARKSDKILFVKVENDGFDLGAQRRLIDKNDMPVAQVLMQAWQQDVVEKGGEGFDISLHAGISALLVEKSRLAENGEYNLAGERYKFSSKTSFRKFKYFKLKELADLIRGITFSKNQQLDYESDESLRIATTKAAQANGLIEKDLYYVPKHLVKDSSKFLRQGDILISTANSLNLLGRTTLINKLDYDVSFGAFMTLIRAKEIIDPVYLFYCLRSSHAQDYYLANANTTTNISNLTFDSLNSFEIPLPSMEVQREIVAEIEGYQRIIDGARMVVENWKPILEIRDDIKLVNLGEFISYISGLTLSIPECVNENGIPIISINNIKEDGSITLDGIRKISIPKNKKPNFLKKGDLLFNWRNGSKKLVG